MDDTQRPTTGEIEQRSSEALRVESRKIRGLVPYSTRSRDMGGWFEVIEPTAFHNTNFTELRAVIDHKGVPLATYPRTLQLEDRSDGLHWSLDPPKSRADVVEAVQRGDMRSGSWRMVVAKDRWEGDTRHVEQISHLYDVTLVGAELPAYPGAAIELRSRELAADNQSNQGEAQEVTMGEQPDHKQEEQHEDRSQEQDTSGGLHVEDRVEVTPRERDLFHELAVAAREVHVGEVRSLTTSVSLVTPEYSNTFFDLLRPQSAFLRSGARVLTTQSNSIVYPQLVSDPTIGWVAEAGTIPASDPGLAAGTATPHKLSVRVEYSNELAEDSAPGIEQILRQVLVSRAAVVVDAAAYEGTGTSPQPRGMGNVAGVSSVNASAANTSLGWAGSAIANLEFANAPRPFAIVGGSALVRDLRQVKAGVSVDSYMFPPTSGDLPQIWGGQTYMANGLAGGTCYVYSPSSCYLVNRLPDFQVEINRQRLFDSDRSEVRLRGRLDYFFPYPGAICRGTAIP